MMQEGARDRPNFDTVGKAHNFKLVQGLYRRFSLAIGRAKAGEIMVTDEALRGFVHRLDIQRLQHMPCPPHIQREWREAVNDPIAISPLNRRKPRMEVAGYDFRRDH